MENRRLSTALTFFFEKSKINVESLLCMCRRNTCNAWYKVSPLAPKCCSVSPSTVLVSVPAILTASNCCMASGFERSLAHGLLDVVGKVRGCFVLVKKH